jgi:hypothetical protein
MSKGILKPSFGLMVPIAAGPDHTWRRTSMLIIGASLSAGVAGIPVIQPPLISISMSTHNETLGTILQTPGIMRWVSPCSSTTTPLFILNTECFWSDDVFRGWKTENGSGGTGYKNMLQWYDF